MENLKKKTGNFESSSILENAPCTLTGNICKFETFKHLKLPPMIWLTEVIISS